MSPSTHRPDVVDTRSGEVLTSVRHELTKHNICCAQVPETGLRMGLGTTRIRAVATCSGLAVTTDGHPREGGPRPRNRLSRPRDFYKFLAIATR